MSEMSLCQMSLSHAESMSQAEMCNPLYRTGWGSAESRRAYTSLSSLSATSSSMSISNNSTNSIEGVMKVVPTIRETENRTNIGAGDWGFFVDAEDSQTDS